MPDVQSRVDVSLPDVQGVSRTLIQEPVSLWVPGAEAEADEPVPDAVRAAVDAECRTCGDTPARLKRGECEACYRYRARTGSARPERLIVAYGQRLLERELARRFIRIA